MAKTHWIIVFTTFLISCLSLALLIVSMCTPYWIVSSAKNENATRNSEVNYGLFSGSLTKYVLSSGSSYELTIICNYGYEACMYSCQQNPDDRLEELRRVLNQENVALCPTSRNRQSMRYLSKTDQLETETYSKMNKSSLSKRSEEVLNSEQYIPPGYWTSTVAFLSISLIFTTLAAVMSILNVIYNPVELILSIFGLYIWNGIAIACMALVLILWGTLFETSLKHNIAITDTLRFQIPYSSEGLATIGYSFWIIFAPIILSIGNILLLLLRKYLIEKQTPPPTITVERNDYTIMLY